jgi:hypothetical protein
LRNKIEEEEEVGGAHVTHGRMRNSYNILFGKPYQKVYLGEWLILKLI